ncbi:NF038132 family protein [Thauera linaloolentis]|uniref:Ice-binding protein C-terminal domain-containing protein n=1 Tax=Thauera linaloolentis (strain DSM 12138 / JCM 21573 / CCUG 41526 / CIP 105981 / IAM 15112 / NBRC 102519 / 47Lol) TaxID=1123367 RepID=N6YGU4_THAL4|nr:NF038132 family protein [Thauera linaloolentis]ENO90720.1 hypothetical protein C666_00800 [Thauera linaloolentis 47Lol = DSM 12138]MCM8565628.1 NF038132 family protein [Thauera linaloolentis]
MSYKNCFVKKSTVLSSLIAAATLCFSAMASAAPTNVAGSLPGGWTGTGSYGTLGANGVVTASSSGGAYGWVSTSGGVGGASLPGVGGTTGSYVRSSAFSANAGDSLAFDFNYITSDGGRFADYAWARLLSSDLTQSQVLFTIRTTPDGNDLIGASGLGKSANSANVSIIGDEPVWSPLGADSGECFDDGCGYTGWINTRFDIADAGEYILEFGVSSWDDVSYHSGLAFDGITVGGRSLIPGQVPEPASLALLGLGFAGLLACGRRRRIA